MSRHLFPLSIGFLAIVALCATFLPRPAPLAGLPAYPLVSNARQRVFGRSDVPLGGLRHRSELLGDVPSGGGRPDPAQVTKAYEDIATAYVRGGRDPRLLAAMGALDLARMQLARAEQHFRQAADRAAPFPEARLGLGVVLAMRAGTDTDLSRAQRTRLQAAAQLAAVDERSPGYPAALYDRAIVLARAGRPGEARRTADAYWRIDPRGPWADALREALASPAE